MTLALAAVAFIGLFIFLINYGRIIFASFKHHFVTGLISLFPGINIVVLPTIWGRTGNAFMISIFGLALAVGGWILGGKKHINQLLNPSTATAVSTIAATESPTTNSPAAVSAPITASSSNFKQLALPPKALYQLSYQTIDLQQTPVSINQQLRVTLKDGSVFEGRLIEPINQSILINHRPTLPTMNINIQDVRKVEQLTKTPF